MYIIYKFVHLCIGDGTEKFFNNELMIKIVEAAGTKIYHLQRQKSHLLLAYSYHLIYTQCIIF